MSASSPSVAVWFQSGPRVVVATAVMVAVSITVTVAASEITVVRLVWGVGETQPGVTTRSVSAHRTRDYRGR